MNNHSLQFKTLSEVSSITSGQGAPQGSECFSDTGTPFIRAGSLEKLTNGIEYNNLEKINDQVAKVLGLKLYPKGSVLFAKSGMSSMKDRVIILKSPSYVVSHLAIVIPNKNLLSDYLVYFLRLYRPSRLIKDDSYPSIRLEDVSKIKIPLPPLPVQKQIAEILEKADRARQKRKEANRLTDEFLKSVFIEMFGDPVKNQKRWSKKKLGELCNIRRGASPRPIDKFLGGTIPWIKIGDGTRGNQIYLEETSEKVTEDGAYKSVLLKEGSLIFANCGVSLGFARILKIAGCIHDGWLALEDIDDKLDKIFLLKLINVLTLYFQSIAPEGTQPNLNTGIMKNFEVILPPIEKQQEFARLVFRTESLKEKQKQSEQELENLFQSLMQKAFKGELFN